MNVSYNVKYKIFLAVMLCYFATVILLCLKTCKSSHTSDMPVIHSDTVRIIQTIQGAGRIDTIPLPYKVEIPIYPVYPISPTSPFEIDTQAIITDYLTKKSYKIPYTDSLADITVDMSISENKLQDIEFQYKFAQTNTVITNTQIFTPKWNIALGLSGTYHINTQKAGINFNAGIDYKKNRFLIGYDPFNNAIGLGYQYKFLNFKKK